MSERDLIISFVLKNSEILGLSQERLSRMTVYDIKAAISDAKLKYPPDPPAPTVAAAKKNNHNTLGNNAHSAAQTQHHHEGGLPGILTTMCTTKVPTSSSSSSSSSSSVAGNHNIVVYNGSDSNSNTNGSSAITKVVSNNCNNPEDRAQLLSDMEDLVVRIGTLEIKLQAQMELRAKVVDQKDFDAQDLATYDQCIARGQHNAALNMTQLKSTFNNFQRSWQTRAETFRKIFYLGLGDDIMHQDFMTQQNQYADRLVPIAKLLGVGFSTPLAINAPQPSS